MMFVSVDFPSPRNLVSILALTSHEVKLANCGIEIIADPEGLK